MFAFESPVPGTQRDLEQLKRLQLAGHINRIDRQPNVKEAMLRAPPAMTHPPAVASGRSTQHSLQLT
jgi:hypothetical protein